MAVDVAMVAGLVVLLAALVSMAAAAVGSSRFVVDKSFHETFHESSRESFHESSRESFDATGDPQLEKTIDGTYRRLMGRAPTPYESDQLTSQISGGVLQLRDLESAVKNQAADLRVRVVRAQAAFDDALEKAGGSGDPWDLRAVAARYAEYMCTAAEAGSIKEFHLAFDAKYAGFQPLLQEALARHGSAAPGCDLDRLSDQNAAYKRLPHDVDAGSNVAVSCALLSSDLCGDEGLPLYGQRRNAAIASWGASRCSGYRSKCPAKAPVSVWAAKPDAKPDGKKPDAKPADGKKPDGAHDAKPAAKPDAKPAGDRPGGWDHRAEPAATGSARASDGGIVFNQPNITVNMYAEGPSHGPGASNGQRTPPDHGASPADYERAVIQRCSADVAVRSTRVADAQRARAAEDASRRCALQAGPGQSRYTNADNSGKLVPGYEWSVPQLRPPVCTTSAPATVMPGRDQTALIGTLLREADKTEVGSILPRYAYVPVE
jgi:hypothetical protein